MENRDVGHNEGRTSAEIARAAKGPCAKIGWRTTLVRALWLLVLAAMVPQMLVVIASGTLRRPELPFLSGAAYASVFLGCGLQVPFLLWMFHRQSRSQSPRADSLVPGIAVAVPSVAMLLSLILMPSSLHETRYDVPFLTFVTGMGLFLLTSLFANVERTKWKERIFADTRLRALRAQLQPHFLFNTLHAIGVTAKDDGPTAQRMTMLLGDLLRASLTDRIGNRFSLADELQLLQPYLQLQGMRFHDRLRIDIDVPERLLGAVVPDLVLQPLLENAIEHGIEQKPGAGRVRIGARTEDGKLVLEVEDDGPGPAEEGEPRNPGIGLGATMQRLDAMHGPQAWLHLRRNEAGGTTVRVFLPLDYVPHAA